MKLSEFVKQTFVELFDGIRGAQEYANNVNASVAQYASSSNTVGGVTMNLEYHCHSNNIQFEIYIDSVAYSEEKRGIGVFASVVGAGINNKNTNELKSLNKISFSVPFTFPVYIPNE